MREEGSDAITYLHMQATSADAASGSDATALGAVGSASFAARTDGTPSRSDDSSTRWLPAPEPLPRRDPSASLQAAHQVQSRTPILNFLLPLLLDGRCVELLQSELCPRPSVRGHRLSESRHDADDAGLTRQHAAAACAA